MRLNKYIASAGVCSRRKADELIVNGNVKINGSVCDKLGQDVSGEDVVSVNGRVINGEKKRVYFALNKPAGYITSMDDEKGRPAVSELVSDVTDRVFPVGRLDYNTTGLLIMTNDGDVANRMAHPSGEVYKTYVAEVEGVVSSKRIERLRNGVDIGGWVTAPAKVRLIKQKPKSAVLEISIREGKNRQVRKMCAAVGNRVQKLERISIGGIRLGRLKEGHYRKLTKDEIDYLKSI